MCQEVRRPGAPHCGTSLRKPWLIASGVARPRSSERCLLRTCVWGPTFLGTAYTRGSFGEHWLLVARSSGSGACQPLRVAGGQKLSSVCAWLELRAAVSGLVCLWGGVSCSRTLWLRRVSDQLGRALSSSHSSRL